MFLLKCEFSLLLITLTGFKETSCQTTEKFYEQKSHVLPSILPPPPLMCRIPVWEKNEENLKALALCPAPVEAIGRVTLISEGEGQSLPVQNAKSLHWLPALPPVCLSAQEIGDN